TGEDGFEIYGSHAFIINAWKRLLASGEVKPCGLGCRDTLRFEAALPLYGHELSDEISPIEAGLGMFVKLNKEEFIGKEAVAEQKANGVSKKVVGIEILDRAIPRNGYDIEVDGNKIGTVTTGYHTITTDRSVCMALIDAKYAAIDTPVDIRIRKKVFPGKVVKKKFYEKKYKK
ncbi:MAG: aminomethyltransferase family protein, partial [Muribaculaceae bacterium]